MTEIQPTPLTDADVKRRYSWGMAPHKSIPGGMYTVAAAAADFDRWLAAHDAEVEARSTGCDLPCDGWCNVNDGPQEECSRHGRTPRDLWGIIEDLIQMLADERAKRPDREHLAQMIAKHRIWSMAKQRVICACGWRGTRDVHELHAADAVLALEPEAREEPVSVARVLHALASLAEEVIHSGDVAEIVAMPPGTTGLAAAVDARDSLYEEPATWIRAQVDRLHQLLPASEAREVTDAEAVVICRRDVPGTVPSWAGKDQIDPCRCVQMKGHDGACVCEHGLGHRPAREVSHG